MTCIAAAAGYGSFTAEYWPLSVFQENGTITIGIPPVYDGTRYCAECNDTHEFEKCPLCGSWIDISFGLGGGGFGEIKLCTRILCPWFFKVCLTEE